MKIVVALKQVPSRDSTLRVDQEGTWIDDSDLTFEVNEPDAYALEAALQLKEKHGGEVVVLCAGPEYAAASVREALAKGADRAIHIEQADSPQLDTLALAGLLAAAVRSESPDLVLTGLQSDDLGSGQTGVVMAELLGLPHATIVMAVEVSGSALRVKRELEDGWFQYVTLPLPAVLTIQSGINRLRYATLMGIKKAKTKELRTIAPEDLGGVAGSQVQCEKLYLPGRAKQTQLLDGDAKAAASALAEKLKFEVRVL
jgi:electron transfer flavoprotein beta subunit